MNDIELPLLPDPKYIWHDADEPGEVELFEFEFAGAVDGLCDICERLYSSEQMQAYARAAVEADRAQRVPDGWKLVPVEPTEEMLCAGDDVLREAFRDRCIATWTIYEAMLTASQKDQK